MSQYTALASPDDFDNGYYIDWSDPPGGPMLPDTDYTLGNNHLDFGDQAVTIDVGGPVVTLSICDANHIRGQFHAGDPVLLADCDPNLRPLHLRFDPPVRAAGAFVGAVGLHGSVFDAVMHVVEAGGDGQGRNVRATLSNVPDSAPFLALRCDDGALIQEVWFDALNADPGSRFTRVAIGPLYYLP